MKLFDRLTRLGLLATVYMSLALPIWSDNVLKIGFAEGNSPPYTFIEQHQLTGGLIWDIGHWLEKDLGVRVDFVFVARGRMDGDLRGGRIDILPISNPDWLATSDHAQWTVALFWENDVFIDNPQFPRDVHRLIDLVGQRIGTLGGYVYPANVQRLFTNHLAERDDVVTLKQNLLKLQNGRIDLIYDSDILLGYALAHDKFEFRVQSYRPTAAWPIKMAVGPHSPVSFSRINASIERMVRSGALEKMFSKYGLALPLHP